MPLSPADIPSHITSEFKPPLELLAGDVPSLPDIYRWNAKNNPNYPLFTYHDGVKREFITYAIADKAIDRVARYIVSALGPYRASAEPVTPPPTVALFANADTITYFCTAVGILRAGCTIFLVSTRNGPAGVADMVQRTGTTHIIVSKDQVIREVAQEALNGLPQGQVTVIDMPTFEDLFPGDGKSANSAFDVDVQLPEKYDLDALGIIIHSSGSTGHPKPLRWRQKRLTYFAREPLLCELDTSRSIMGCHGTPMFHGLGMFMFAASPICGYVIAAFKPASPPTFPTPDAVWQGIVATGSDFTWTVPSFIEEWARDPEKIAHMKRMRGVMFGGAPLNEEVGNALASQGVNLFTVYGMTEVGLVNLFVRPNPGMDWAYWTPSPTLRVKFLPRDQNQYEVVVMSPPEFPLPATNTTIDGEEAYASSDLAEPHPTKPNLWKIVGRADEQIILSNGEKTNPLPLERIINQDPHVKCSVMFGRGKFQNGVLIEPRDEFAINPSDSKQVEEFRNKIWPTVERANEYAPRHSRIFKEMILVASPAKPFQYNVKGLPRRKIILDEYHDEIEALYQEVENSSQNDLKPPEEWDEESTYAFVRAVVEHTLRRSIADDADIFRNGGDSLQATWIRNTIMRAVRETDAKAPTRLPMNLVFKAPTISALAEIVYNALHHADAADDAARTPGDLWKYVEKYSSNLPARPDNLVERPSSGKDVVLITGTTGGFGCDALEHLLRDESVARVYAFNRKGTNALDRQRAQFRARGFDEGLLTSPKFKMVEAVLHERGFAIDQELLDEVRESVAHILHNAWQVNFNLSLSSFEVDLQGARNIVELAIGSPFKQAPTVLFVSSVGIFMNYKGAAPVPEVPLGDPASPFGVGYSESKWVTEHVLENVTKQTGVHTVVMRLGQVAGDRVGHWNEKEWFPALVKSAQFQRCLPDIKGNVTWIPGYEAAKAFTEMRHSPEPFLHLVHPRPVPWHDIIAPIAEELGVSLVSYEQWVSALQNSVSRGEEAEVELLKANPALRLLDFFKAVKQSEGSADREPLGMVYLSTEKSTKVSRTLAHLPQLDADRAKKWVLAWKKSGFL
ncbi:acetyl-CoA synthetase-like protein [Trametes coccinea BRFM310]|uniref:Acetyl-CoA synthetase-like protein n=1 Tax=Trametes coccinea (strain BRFM310) TaxID=1353009 RepID=A0A1Y2IDS1_TRAC3|nr:acetyl-CoA synthetase-like protein [Trametes coccinea BRFM310]